MGASVSTWPVVLYLRRRKYRHGAPALTASPERPTPPFAAPTTRGHATAANNLGVLLERRGESGEAGAAYRRASERGRPGRSSISACCLRSAATSRGPRPRRRTGHGGR